MRFGLMARQLFGSVKTNTFEKRIDHCHSIGSLEANPGWGHKPLLPSDLIGILTESNGQTRSWNPACIAPNPCL